MGKWSQDEIKYLEENWQTQTDEELSKKLNRSRGAIKAKRNKIKALRSKGGFVISIWTEEEDEIIKKHYVPNHFREKNEAVRLIQKLLHGRRSYNSILNRICQLGIAEENPNKTHVKNGQKLCQNCREVIDLSDFLIDNRNNKHKSYCSLCRKRIRATSLYKITNEEYDKLQKQKYCNICGKEDELHIDHCHTTGKVRGMLCRLCNSALGVFGDNIEGLQKALEYLKNASS